MTQVVQAHVLNPRLPLCPVPEAELTGLPPCRVPRPRKDEGTAGSRLAGDDDLRRLAQHTVASQATLAGVLLTVTARLLGHSDVRMAMRYAHVGDREVEDAAERVGQAIAAMIAG